VLVATRPIDFGNGAHPLTALAAEKNEKRFTPIYGITPPCSTILYLRKACVAAQATKLDRLSCDVASMSGMTHRQRRRIGRGNNRADQNEWPEPGDSRLEANHRILRLNMIVKNEGPANARCLGQS